MCCANKSPRPWKPLRIQPGHLSHFNKDRCVDAPPVSTWPGESPRPYLIPELLRKVRGLVQGETGHQRCGEDPLPAELVNHVGHVEKRVTLQQLPATQREAHKVRYKRTQRSGRFQRMLSTVKDSNRWTVCGRTQSLQLGQAYSWPSCKPAPNSPGRFLSVHREINSVLTLVRRHWAAVLMWDWTAVCFTLIELSAFSSA